MLQYTPIKEGNYMAEIEFQQILDNFYQRMTLGEELDDILVSCGMDNLAALNSYVAKNYKHLNLIHINNIRKKNDKLLLNTSLGTFLLDNPTTKTGPARVKTLKNQDINLLEFYGILFHNDLEYTNPKYESKIKTRINYYQQEFIVSKNIIKDFLKAYCHCRMIQDPKQQKQLFIKYNKMYASYPNNKSIPLECLINEDYNDLVTTNKIYTQELQNIYNCYYRFDKNIDLMFTFIVFTKDLSKKNYIKENISQFKKFIITASSKTTNNNIIRMIYQYLVESEIIALFSEEDLKLLYQANIYYWSLNKKIFKEVALKIENKSPMIRLNNQEKTLVHIRYQDYDLYKGTPAKLQASLKHKDFLKYFLFHNTLIYKLYNMYYTAYQKAILKNSAKDNLYDFIKCMLLPNNLIKIYKNPNISRLEIKKLLQFKDYYGEKIQEGIELVQEKCRQKSLATHNLIVKYHTNQQEIDKVLDYLNFTKSTIYTFVLEDKSLYVLEKEAILNILITYYQDSIRLTDILSIIEESIVKDTTYFEIIREKEIPLKPFSILYNNTAAKNPILSEGIFKNWDEKTRKEYLKLLNFGYQVLESSIASLEEYQQLPNVVEINALIASLDGTYLAKQLLDKVSKWPDYGQNIVSTKSLVLFKKIKN